MSHIRWHHSCAQLADPLKDSQIVSNWLTALTKKSAPPRGKLPISPPLLILIIASLPYIYDGVLNPARFFSTRAALCTGLGFMLRSKDYVDAGQPFHELLTWGKVTFSRDGASQPLSGDEVSRATRVTLQLSSDKNDLGNVTRSVARTDASVCCVRALVDWYNVLLAYQPSALLPEKPVFLSNLDGDALTRKHIATAIKTGIEAQCNFPKELTSRFASHSLRHGGMTAYVAANPASLELLKIWGRWKSDAWKVYVKIPTTALDPILTSAQCSAPVLELR